MPTIEYCRVCVGGGAQGWEPEETLFGSTVFFILYISFIHVCLMLWRTEPWFVRDEIENTCPDEREGHAEEQLHITRHEIQRSRHSGPA